MNGSACTRIVCRGAAARLGAHSGFSDLNELAGGIRSAMKEAAQAARRLDVYPGVRRDLRRQYRLDWRGWE